MEVSNDYRKVNVMLTSKMGKRMTGNFRLISLTFVLGKIMKQILWITSLHT